MKPFRFFFGLSLGVILFVFLARFVLLALALAAVMSIAFYFARKIKRFFQRLRWTEEQEYYSERQYGRHPQSLPVWKGDLLWEYPNRVEERVPNYRIIEIQ